MKSDDMIPGKLPKGGSGTEPPCFLHKSEVFAPGDSPFCVTPDGILIVFYQCNPLSLEQAKAFAEAYSGMARRNTILCPKVKSYDH